MARSDPRVLVIGGSGFLGRRVVRALLADGRPVRCLARDPARVQDLSDAGCEVVGGDMLDAGSVERAVAGVGAVCVSVHTLSRQAANGSGQDFMGVERTGLQHIVQACRTHGVRRLAYVTAIGVAPDAPSAWLRGRWETEQLLFASGLDVSVLRPGMIVGRGGTGFDVVLSGARRPVAVALGSRTRRFRTIAVDDLASYVVDALDDPRAIGHAYDVGSDDVLTTDQMIDLAAEHLGRRPPVTLHLPARVLGLAAPLIERLGGLPRGAVTGLVDGADVDMAGDPTAARTTFSRVPRSYRQALDAALGEA